MLCKQVNDESFILIQSSSRYFEKKCASIYVTHGIEREAYMDAYLKDSLDKIYGEKDDFIIIGLTGRTGSGCTTVASILSQEKEMINHSLYNGTSPVTNEDRKERILYSYFDVNWCKFLSIKVSSIITLMLSDEKLDEIKEFISNFNESQGSIVNSKAIDSVIDELSQIKQKKKQIKKNKSYKTLVDFYSSYIDEKTKNISELVERSWYTLFYQKIGRNIRMSGSAINESLINGKFISLSIKIANVIKEIRKLSKGENEKTFVVIDAIRNPLEALYFQERYASFYLMAVSCDDTDRVKRLEKLGYDSESIAKLDANEGVDKELSENDGYFNQDIPSCLQRADIYLNNAGFCPGGNFSKDKLSNQLIKFISLIRRPGLVTPSAMERCMQIAYTAKLNSGCISRQVGAIITDENYSVQAVGWNDTPKGQVPCNLRCRKDLHRKTDVSAFSKFELTNEGYRKHQDLKIAKLSALARKGLHASYCFKSEYNKFTGKDNQVHTRSLHAEENAFLQASKYGGRGIEGGKLFTTASPCELCAKKAYQLGIKEIYYIDRYPGISESHILMGGAFNPQLILFTGAIGRAFHNLYSPLIPYKDESNALMNC